MFTYSEDESKFSGFWFYDNDKHNYAINDRGKIVISNSIDPYLKRGTFVRRIGLDKGEIGETQNDKNDKRMVYINKDILVNKILLSYNEDTLIINNLELDGNYYIEFSDLEGNETQLIVEINEGTKSGNIIKQIGNNFNYNIDNIETNDLGVSFDITDGNNDIVYAYRSRDIDDSEFENIGDDGATYENTTLLGVHLTSGIESIGSSAFIACVGLTQVTIPNSVTFIGGVAFNDCSGLTQIKIPNNVTTIGNSAFSGCFRLIQIEISNSVKTIDEYAFAYCSGLKEITIPDSVTLIHDNAFNDCSGLTKIIIKGTLTYVGENTFNTNPEPTTSTPRLGLTIQCNEATKRVIAEAIKGTDYENNISFKITTESN